MQALGFTRSTDPMIAAALYCCECNLCSLYSCPEDLDPKGVCTENKQRLLAEKRRYENPPFNPRRPELHLENRKAPMARLMQKLGLSQFRNVGPLREDLLGTNRVGIALKQHIGAACEPAVGAGDRVSRGQLVGRRPVADGKPALGAPVHASIDGVVRTIEDGIVWIERK